VDRGGPPLVAGRAGVAVPVRGGQRHVLQAIAKALTGPLPDPAAIRASAEELQLSSRGERLDSLIVNLGLGARG
jgi:hypothetical protein